MNLVRINDTVKLVLDDPRCISGYVDNSGRFEWFTVQESNLRVPGSEPGRDAGNPPVIKLDQAAGIGPAWAAFKAQLGYQQPTPE